MFTLGTIFGCADNPGTENNYLKVNDDMYWAVSYTHLDVYKRQHKGCRHSVNQNSADKVGSKFRNAKVPTLLSICSGLMPRASVLLNKLIVSDVYKRQADYYVHTSC